MMDIRNAAYIFFELVLCFLVNYASAIDVENLKIGCFPESPLSREFHVSPGDYQPWSLTPYECVKLCGNMKYNFAALQNGDLCFCANTFNASQGASANCNINCTGDQRYICGGMWTNLVYNSTSYARKLVINYSSTLKAFEWVNLTAGFANESTPGLQVAFNIGDGNGDSPGERAAFNFRAPYWGKMTVKARSLNVNPKLDYVDRVLYIRASPGRAELKCPTFARTGDKFSCVAKVYEGTSLQATWMFQNGNITNVSLPNPLYVRAGPALPQWAVPGLTSLHGTGVFLLPSSRFTFEARILALEIYGHTAGDIKVFVMRPICTPPTPYYCLTNLSCAHQQCPTHSSYACSSPNILCASKSCCHHPSSANCSQSPTSTILSANNLEITTVIGVLTVKTGYNLHVLPKEQTLNVLPGDMIAWGPASDGKIAQQAGNTRVYHFPRLEARMLQSGSNVSIINSRVIPHLTYMFNIIGSQASRFELSHQFGSSGEYWAQVNLTDILGNSLVPTVQHILVQSPLTIIEPVYPRGFSFLGARKNREIHIVVKIPSDTSVTVSWNLVNSSSLLKRETLQSSGNDYVLASLNQTFPSLGFYIIFVEAANNVSVANTTIIVNVQEALSDLNVSLISDPVYLGALTKFNVSASGTNVKFKWIFGDGIWTPYISNTTVVHRFSKTGTLNVSVIATNLAFSERTWFTLRVLQPLSITLPLQGVVGVIVNLSCSLIGLFDSDQYYYWDYGDGSTEEGLNKLQVAHNYSKGGTYNVSVRLKNEVLVYAAAELLVLEPVSGLTLYNITGVELFDNKTFTARTITGNNLTYEWYLQGNNTITIMICANNSIELFFNATGLYTISVNVSNSISFETASISFSVQRRITGIGITAFPNPAPSNSTITFNVTKGTGSDVKYRLDFGDGFVLQDFPPNYLFNRTFTSGQWQIIFTGENAVNHVIVFYNVTVQDPVKNISVGYTAENEHYGRKIVPVGSDTRFCSNVSEGTDVYFRWDFGDGTGTRAFKGLKIPTGETNHSVGHSFSRSGEFNVTVQAFNAISQLGAWVMVHAQQRIEDFELIMPDRASPGQAITFQLSQSKGDNVSYIINFGDGGSRQIVTTNSFVKSYVSVGVFNVTAEAVNQISSQTIVKSITVQRQIQGLGFMHPIRAVETGLQTVITWSISDGSDVKFVIDYGDGTAAQTMEVNVVGMNVTVRHNYTSWGEYLVTITAYNLVGPNKTISGKALVDDPIVGLAAYAQRSTIQLYDNAVIIAKVLKGSRVTYDIEFGDGSNPVQTLNNTVIHQYRKYGVFNVVVTARNSLTSTQTQLNDTITVEKPNTPLEIRGLNLSCQATIPGNASDIFITYEYGFLFQCNVDFGDGTTERFSDETLPLPLLHTYSTAGSFEVTVQCENQFGSHIVKTTAHVDEVITGLKFNTESGIFQKDFGQSVVIEWTWATGTNVDLSVTLSGYGSIASQKTGQTRSVELGSAQCPSPGKYDVDIELSNSVSPLQKLKATVTFLEKISDLTVRFNPVARTGSPVPIYVSVDSGLDVMVRWGYGDGSDYSRQTKGFGKQKFLASHVYNTQGQYEIEVVTSNENSAENVKGTITVLGPVQGFSFHQHNTVTWPSRNIIFQFNRGAQFPDLFNATYRIEFGNGQKSPDQLIDPVKTLFSYNYLYPNPGCYKAKLIIWNFVSRVELWAPVEIIELITNAELRALHSKYSAHPGTSGGGPNGNTFPFEYPVSFTVKQDTGTCLMYNWSFGDYNELQNASTSVTEHAYPLPGSYNAAVKVYNSLGERVLRRSVTLQYSVMGLYLAASGPAKPGESVNFLVFCSSLGTNSQFVFNAGEGGNVKLRNFKNNTQLKAEKRFLNPNINLPFDPSSFYAKVYSHVYSQQGIFEAQVWGWNDASQQSAPTSVVVTDKPVPVPRVQVVGGQKSLKKSQARIFGKRSSLSSQVEIQGNETYMAVFEWVVYRADSYQALTSSSHVQLPPESGREVSLPPGVITNQSSITIPGLGLGPGEYIFQLSVTIFGVGVSNADYTYIKISGADIEARIAGGDLRSHDWEQQLLLDATESRDPLSLGNEELNYAWFCDITEGDASIVNSRRGCFGNGENKGEFTGKIFTLAPRSLFEATTYVFTVNVSSAGTGRWSTATQTVKVLTESPPDIQIRCERNCGKYLNPSSRLILTTTCLNCDDVQAISYNWSAEDVQTSVPFAVWPDRALTPRYFQNAVILGGTFKRGASYRIRVVASRQNSEAQGFAEYNIITNQPPTGGTCDVTPKTGEELETRFTFSCSAWQDEHEPLTYEMFYSHPSDSNKDPGSSPNGVLFFFGPSLAKAEFSFTAGREEDDRLIEIVVVIKDAYGESVENKLQIQVKPMNVSQDELRNKTLLAGNEVEKEIALGSDIIAMQLINIVSNILNNKNDTGDYALKEHQRIRLSMIKYLAGLRPQTLDDVLLRSQTLQAATAVAKETTVEAQVLATKQYAYMAEMLTKESQMGEDGGVIEKISSEMLKGLSNVFLATARSSSDTLNDPNKETAKKVLVEVLDLVEKVSDAVLHTMIPGQSPLIMKSEGLAIGLSKQTPSNLAGFSVDVGGEGQFVLPNDGSLINRTKNSSFISTTVTELSTNPFQGSGNSTLVKSNPISLVLKGPGRNVIPVESLTSPINIFLPQRDTKQISQNISRTPSASGSMMFHKVSIPNPDSTIKAEILPSDESSELTVYFRYNESPSLTEYDFKTTLPHQDYVMGNYTLFMSRDQMKGAGDYYIGVLPRARDNEPIETSINYTFDVISSACYFWDDTSLDWSSKGCQVHSQSTRSLTRCQCTHLTWFGADLFIPPNKLDIKGSIKKLAEIYKHPALLATFCVITGLYILALVRARRKDRKDITKVGLVPVLDNDPTDRYRYEVTVYTARGKNTGTTANVSILIAGRGRSERGAYAEKHHPGYVYSLAVLTHSLLPRQTAWEV